MRQDFLNKYYNGRNEDVDMYCTAPRSGVESMCINRLYVMARALAEA